MSFRTLAPFAIVALTACSSVPGIEKPAKDPSLPIPAKMAYPPPPDDAVVYTCENGVKFKATFSDEKGDVRIEPENGAPYTLYIAATGSGFAYADGGRELRGKGEEAMWTDKDKPATKCTAAPAG